MSKTSCTFNNKTVFDSFIPSPRTSALDKLQAELQKSWLNREHCSECYRRWFHVYKYVNDIIYNMTDVEGNWKMFDEQFLQDQIKDLPW